MCESRPAKLGIMVVCVATTHPAWAYLDPGAAYMSLQWLLGLVAGAGAALLLYWRSVTATVRRWSGRGRRRLESEARGPQGVSGRNARARLPMGDRETPSDAESRDRSD